MAEHSQVASSTTEDKKKFKTKKKRKRIPSPPVPLPPFPAASQQDHLPLLPLRRRRRSLQEARSSSWSLQETLDGLLKDINYR